MWLVVLMTITLVAAIGAVGPDRLVGVRPVPIAAGVEHVPGSRPRKVALDPRRRRALAALGASAAAVTLLGVVAGALVVVMVVGGGRIRSLLSARSTAAAQRAALPDAIDTFVLLVHAGLTPQLAVEHLAAAAPQTIRPAFAAATNRTRRGEPFADTLDALLEHFGSDAVAFVDLVAASSRYGLPIANVLAQLSAETRAARRRLDEAAARALPVRLSFPLVVCTLPSFVLLAIAPAVLAALSSLGDTSW